MSKSIPLVSSAEEVSVDWLTGALAEASASGLQIEGFTSASIGTGQMAESVRFELQYAGNTPKGPDSIVLKLPSVDPTSRATAVAQSSYAREVRFYSEMASTLDIRTPRCWHADLSDGGDRFVLVLEDMAPSEPGDQLEGCTLDQARLAMQEAARLHGPRWNDPELTHLSWLSQSGPDSAKLLEGLYRGVLPGFQARFESRLDDDVLALTQRFGQAIGRWAEHDEGPRCVVHGDYRLDNMLFRSERGGVPLTVVDWQTCACGHPAGDVAYFLGAGLLPEVRRETETELLATYHASLLEGGVSDYSLDTLNRDYLLFSFSGLIMAVVASQIVQASDRGDSMFAVMAERHARQIIDHEAEALI